MGNPNVVVIVIDTLRGDYPGELDKLLDMGFTKLNAVAPSSWTLPSHVSMFTGELPSSHGVRAFVGIGWKEIMQISKRKMEKNALLASLKDRGYTTYGHSANQFVSPNFGFVFDHFGLFEAVGVVPGPRESAPKLPLYRKVAPLVMRRGPLGGFVRWALLGVVGRLLLLSGVQTREKGGTAILKAVRETEFKEPFFEFVNLMEPHQPYLWWGLDTLTVRLSMLGRPPHTSWWRKLYPAHSLVATSRAVEIVSSLLKYDPLIIVTSDHGQLIGESGRFGHGWSLDEPLLKVPMFVRLPQGARPEVKGPVVSLTEVPGRVEMVVTGEKCGVGSDFALAEGWGFEISDVREILEREGRASNIFAARVRVFSAKGSVLVDRQTGAVEEATPGMSKEEAEGLARLVPKESAAAVEVTADEMAPQDEREMRERLKKLGYE